MTKVEHYRAKLEECERFAEQTTDSNDRMLWTRLVQHYNQLIDQLQKPNLA